MASTTTKHMPLRDQARRIAANPHEATTQGQRFLAWATLKAERGQPIRQARLRALAKWGAAQ